MKIICSIALSLFLIFANIAPVAAQNFYYFSNDNKIINALKVLEYTDNVSALKTLKEKKHNLKIRFYNLSLLSYEYADYYALATSNKEYDYILINSKYKDSPKEAIASLIAHELTHKLATTTFEEEVLAWTNEAKQWIKCKANLKNTKPNKLIKRLNKIENLYKNKLIAQEIKSLSAYKKLAWH